MTINLVTAKVLIFGQNSKILLIHKRRDDSLSCLGGPSGWCLPEVDIVQEEVVEFGVDCFRIAMIRGVLNRTGFKIKIKEEIMISYSSTHSYSSIIYKGEVLSGKLKTNTSEMDNAGWFYYDESPSVDESLDYSQSIYLSEKEVIKCAIEKLGIESDLAYTKWYAERTIT